MFVRRLAVLGLGLVCALTITGVTGATATAKKQRVVINMKERPGVGSFTLIPMTQGPLVGDAGKYTWITTSKSKGEQDGQEFERVVATVTYEGKQGTFVVKEVDTLVAVGIGQRVSTGTWKIVRGTGVYAGVTGSGRLAAALGIVSPDPWRYEGFLTTP